MRLLTEPVDLSQNSAIKQQTKARQQSNSKGRKRERLRSRNRYIDAYLDEEEVSRTCKSRSANVNTRTVLDELIRLYQGGDDYADLEDFIADEDEEAEDGEAEEEADAEDYLSAENEHE